MCGPGLGATARGHRACPGSTVSARAAGTAHAPWSWAALPSSLKKVEGKRWTRLCPLRSSTSRWVAWVQSAKKAMSAWFREQLARSRPLSGVLRGLQGGAENSRCERRSQPQSGGFRLRPAVHDLRAKATSHLILSHLRAKMFLSFQNSWPNQKKNNSL